MDKLKNNTERLIEGLHKITGIKLSTLKDYARNYNIFDIIDHPMTIGVTDKQYEKLRMLKGFINSYQYLRENEAEHRISLRTPEKAGHFFVSQMAYFREKEVIICAYMNSQMHILSCEKISEGSIDQSAIFPREVLKRALQLDCVGIILSHNHPSGSTAPSMEDVNVTKRFTSIFHPLGMKVFDHFIIADNRYLSMNEQGFLRQEFDHVPKADYEPIQLHDELCDEFDISL